jgi:tetratricopeptide (TPR) repeat protein
MQRTSVMMVFSQVAAGALVVGLIHLLVRPVSPLVSLAAGAMVYLVYSYGSRLALTGAHRRGMWLIRRRQWQPALKAFEASYAFFTRYPWLDEYRFLTMLTASAISYREMALNNMGYALLQSGEYARAQVYYARLLEQFPHTVLAGSARRVLAAIAAKQGGG